MKPRKSIGEIFDEGKALDRAARRAVRRAVRESNLLQRRLRYREKREKELAARGLGRPVRPVPETRSPSEILRDSELIDWAVRKATREAAMEERRLKRARTVARKKREAKRGRKK